MILGLETSTSHASLALVDPDSGTVAWQSQFETDRAHNAAIFEPVTEMLASYRDKISGIAVGIGPGSYGGVRVGIAVANGLSLVLGVPVRGVSSLVCWNVPGESYYVLGDARRKSIFVAEVNNRILQEEPRLLDEDKIEDEVSALRGKGHRLFSADPAVANRWEGVTLNFPDAVALCRVAGKLPVSAWPAPGPLEPHYLRAPYITTPKKKPLR